MKDKIGLGSAQWGSIYGVSNVESNKVNKSELSNILSYSRSLNLKLIDTAPTYGDVEKNLSKQNLDGFNIITKTPKLLKEEINKNNLEIINYSVKRSLDLLNQNSLYAILVHNPLDLLLDGGNYISDILNKLKQKGLVKKIGISLYNSENLDKICKILNPDIVQLPINVIDQRFILDGSLEYLKKKNIEIHARSLYLQGLLLMNFESINSYFNPWKKFLKNWYQECKIQNFTPLEAALDFVIKIKDIDYCILGVHSKMQLEESILNLKNKKNFDATNLKCLDDNFINPSRWILS